MATVHPPTFGELLKHYRVGAGLTQEALAERARLSARGISDLERGVNRRPRMDTVRVLATVLGLSDQERAMFVAAGREMVARPQLGAPAPPLSKGRHRSRMAEGIPRRSSGARASWACWSAT